MGLSKEELLARMRESHPDGTVDIKEEVMERESIQFSEVETQILSAAVAEAQNSIDEFQKVTELSQQKRDVMLGLTKAADKVYRTIMILKKINPDAYELSWNPQTNELVLKKK
jgi:hypothetical protein